MNHLTQKTFSQAEKSYVAQSENKRHKRKEFRLY